MRGTIIRYDLTAGIFAGIVPFPTHPCLFFKYPESEIGVYRTQRSINFLAIIALRVCGLSGALSLNTIDSHNGTRGGFYLLITHSTTGSQNFSATELMVERLLTRLLIQSNKQLQSHKFFTLSEQQVKLSILYSAQEITPSELTFALHTAG
jgi:hypothetical protein